MHLRGSLELPAKWSGIAIGTLTLTLALGTSGCDSAKAWVDEAPSAAVMKSAEDIDDSADWEGAMVPPEDGPKLAPIAMKSAVYSQPNSASDKVGYLRLGAKVARTAEPVSGGADCRGGWYGLRPVGYACAGDDNTLKLDHPLVKAIAVEPDRSKPMPYKYAFIRAVAPNYLRVPSTEEQFRYEMRLERHLRNWKKLSYRWDALEVGANDVPLGEGGLANGPIPANAIAMTMGERFGGESEGSPWWLRGERRIPNVSGFRAPPYAVIASRIKRHAGVALIGNFTTGEEAQGRRFAISTDARLIPADKLKADSGSPFHGESIREHGLPVAFARKAGATWWNIKKGKLKKGERLKWREFISLTGNVRKIQGVRMVEARNGQWVRSKDLKTAPKNSKLPWFAKGSTRWIDISILSQTLVLWEGNIPIYATLISTGRDGVGDPKRTLSTPQGTFKIYQKHVTTTMDSDAADSEFELRDVPWVMYFKGGYALHAAYWHDDFGRGRSHGCVNLSPIDARYAFQWSSPDVPEHWHAAYTGDTFGKGTLVHIHP
ncbi:MAG: L,D-transpeptidase [Polyangiaceae bacterium]|nr:L,D-transpeptidase [Polyangiaceae bacterium]